MTRHIPTWLRNLVVERAANRCEYCELAQVGQAATFHVDHVVPLAAGGPTIAVNLALACVSCSLRKGARQSVVDPASGLEVPIFNPRRQTWREHFRWNSTEVVGLTPTGRAMIAALDLNRPMILAIRTEEQAVGRHPAAS